MTVLNRDQISARMLKRAEDFERGYRQNLALLGRAGLGKTKLITRFTESIRSRESSVLTVFIDLAPVSANQITFYWIRCLLSAALALPDSSLEILLDAADSQIPKTAKAARHILKLHKQGNAAMAVREIFALSGQLAEESTRKVILILDEFLGLEKFAVHDVYSIFGNRMMMEKEVLFIVTSSDSRKSRTIFSEKLSLLFSNFETMDLQSFGFKEMNANIDTRACASYLSLPARRFLFRLTDGDPRYLDALLRALDDLVCMDPKRQLGIAPLFETVMREVLEPDGRISLLFQKRVESLPRGLRESQQALTEAVALLSAGRVKPGALAAAIGLKIPEVKKMISRMEDAGWLISGGASYSLRDSLFRFWAHEVLLPDCQGQLLDEKSRRSRWMRLLGSLYEAGCESDSGKIAAQMEALLKQFRSGAIQLEGRKIYGAHFQEISWSAVAEGVWLVRGTASKENHFYLASSRELTENDVEEFKAASGRQKKRVHRILVAASGIEQNAKLLAQQYKMDIWDLRFFNLLLDFHGLTKSIMEKRNSLWDHEGAWVGAEGLFSSVTK